MSVVAGIGSHVYVKKCAFICTKIYSHPISFSFSHTVDTCDDIDAKLKMRKYCEELPRPFFALYNAQTETVHIDRPVRRAVGVPTPSS